jgi:hypothetical protein
MLPPRIARFFPYNNSIHAAMISVGERERKDRFPSALLFHANMRSRVLARRVVGGWGGEVQHIRGLLIHLNS